MITNVLALCKEFQFTHPGGVRPKYFLSTLLSPYVSIHAPGRGATDTLA